MSPWSKTLVCITFSWIATEPPPKYTSVKHVPDEVGTSSVHVSKSLRKMSNGPTCTSKYALKLISIVYVVDIHTCVSVTSIFLLLRPCSSCTISNFDLAYSTYHRIYSVVRSHCIDACTSSNHFDYKLVKVIDYVKLPFSGDLRACKKMRPTMSAVTATSQAAVDHPPFC